MDGNFAPSKTSVGLSLMSWVFMYIGLIAVRAELHPWVNTIILTVVYPMFLWFMIQNNSLSLVSRGSMIAMVIGAILFMTLLMEAAPKTKMAQNLKKSMKEYGKDPVKTTVASGALFLSLVIGGGVSYLVTGDNFLITA